MAAPLSHRRFRIQLEFDVTIDEIDQEHLNAAIPPQTLPYLKKLQTALMSNESVLLRLIQARLVGQLQSYTDDLAGQDSLRPLRQVDANLEIEENEENNLPEIDFRLLTWPVRNSTIHATLATSTLSERSLDDEGKALWRPVWNDLRPESELGKWPRTGAIQPRPASTDRPTGHYFSLHYLAWQESTVHLEATCSCGLVLEGSGADEWQALKVAWEGYHQHLHMVHQLSLEADRSDLKRQEN